MLKAPLHNDIVLVGVLKNKNDRRILLRKRWYRIPVAFLPKRQFAYLAFYQPVLFGKRGKRIEYYARVAGRELVKRIDLLPKEQGHPRAHDAYAKIGLTGIKRLPRPIKNIIPRRISFGFTTLKRLLSSKDILELYGVPPTEQIVSRGLAHLGVKTAPEHPVSSGPKRYRIDLALFCKNGAIAIECDNRKAHAQKAQKAKDRAKDASLERLGWRVMRLKERDIIERFDYCAARIQKAVRSLGGSAIKSRVQIGH